jgi:formylglycine-generating enzyme required for sulfatase activity/sugar lactone lactonase YvrE/methionine-rich copper-binding protein CopC
MINKIKFPALVLLSFFMHHKIMAQNPNWTINSANYQYQMQFTSALQFDRAVLTSENDRVAVFVDNEIRGVGKITFDNADKKYVSFFTAYSNTINETLTFKLYNSATDSVVNAIQTKSFIIDEQVGGVFQSFVISNTALNNEAELIDFNFQGVAPVSNSKSGNTFNIIIPSGTDITTLKPIFSTSSGANAFINYEKQNSNINILNFSNNITYQILSEDQEVLQNFTINVALDSSPTNPTVILSTLENFTTKNKQIQITINFSESISALIDSDFQLSNAVISDINKIDNTTYSATLTFINEGDTAITLPENAVINNSNLGNISSNTLNFLYDEEPPILLNQEHFIELKYFQITFSENVSNVSLSDFSLFGSLSSFFVLDELDKVSDAIYKISYSGSTSETGSLYLQTNDNAGIIDYATNSIIKQNNEAYYLDNSPVFENDTPKAINISETGLTLQTDINLAGTIYYVVLSNNAEPPSPMEVKNGTGNLGTPAVAAGNANTNAVDFVNNFNITGLTSLTSYDIYIIAQDDLNTPNLQRNTTLLEITTIDETAPTFVSINSTPEDNSTDISLSDNIIMAFSEDIAMGSGNITLKSSSSIVETFNVETHLFGETNPGEGKIGVSGNKVYINPSYDLNGEQTYHIHIDNTAIKDNFNNNFKGISDETTYNFTTISDSTAPSFTSTPITNINDGDTYNYVISADDIDSDLINIRATTLPTWIEFNSNATVSTFAGASSGYINNTGTSARFKYPRALATDNNGNLYIADQGNYRIRKITSDAEVSTLAGKSSSGNTDDTGENASFNNPYGVALDAEGNVYVADRSNHRIRKITPDGLVSHYAGSTSKVFDHVDGNSTSARFRSPNGVAVDAVGNVYVADTGNNNIRKIDINGNVTTIAGGNNPNPGSTDANGTSARFKTPTALVLDKSGNIYVCDTGNNKIRKIDTSNNVTTIAGNTDNSSGRTDANGTGASFDSPRGIALDAFGNLYVADMNNHSIRKITPAGDVTTLAGDGSTGSRNGSNTNAEFNFPRGIAIDNSNNLFVADQSNHKIRKIILDYTLTGDSSGKVGDHDIVLQAIDGDGKTTQQNFTLNVSGTIPTFNSASSKPKNNEINTATTTNIELSFSENIKTGSGNIYLRNNTSNTIIETYNITIATNTNTPIDGDIGILNNTLYINPTTTLLEQNEYTIQIDATAITDLTGNPFSGITLETPYTFSTGDFTAPSFENNTPYTNIVNETSFSLETDINEAGTIYYIILPNNATAPTAAEVKEGTGNGGISPITFGSAILNSGAFNKTFDITELITDTNYDIYIIAKDDADTPNLQTTPTLVQVTLTTQILPNGIIMKDIDGGILTMGNNTLFGSEDQKAAAPEHQVEVSAYSMSEAEITNDQYVEFLNAAFNDGLIQIVIGISGPDKDKTLVTGGPNSEYNGEVLYTLDGIRVLKDHGNEDEDDNEFTGSVEPENPLNIAYIGFNYATETFYVKDPYNINDFNWKEVCNYQDYGTTPKVFEGEVLNDFDDWAGSGLNYSNELQGWTESNPEGATNLPTQADVSDWPVTFIRWRGAKAFADYYNVNIPTEAQWEFAAKGGSNFEYAVFDGTSVSDANWNKAGINNLATGHVRSAISGNSNPFGLYNLAGNVWEWIADNYVAPYDTATVKDPFIEENGSTLRSWRGGAWNYHKATLQSSIRFYDDEDRGNDHFGFRITGSHSSANATAPTFENGTPNASNIGSTSFNLNTDIDKAGTVYYIILTNNVTAPSPSEVKAGTGNNGVSVITSGNIILNSGDFTNIFNITGLTSETSYDVYVVAEDDESTPNLQNEVTLIEVTTVDITAPTFISNDSNPIHNGTNFSASANIVMAFSEDIVFGTNKIAIKEVSNNTTIEDFDVTVNNTGGNNPAPGEIGISGRFLYINPTQDLVADGRTYAIHLNANAIDDLNGNSFAGISNNSFYNFSTNTVITWTGATNTDWATSSNWNSNQLPSAVDNIIIPNVTNSPIINVGTNATAQNITIDASSNIIITGGNLTVNGDLTNNGNVLTINSGGSLIAGGAVTGEISYTRSLATTNWYGLTAPVIGQDIDAFVTASNLETGQGNNVGLGSFNNINNSWSFYQSDTPFNSNFLPSVGHIIKLKTAGNVQYTGTMLTEDITTLGLLDFSASTGSAFNLVGNPYPSFIDANSLLTNNDSEGNDLLSESTIWVWNQSKDSYDTYNLASDFFIAPTQGFFVKAEGNASTFKILEAMQSHQSESFQKNSRPEIKIELSNGKQNRDANIYYINGTTTGFDNGYDSNLFGGVADDLSIYTALVENSNGEKLSIQSLPNSNYAEMVIPVGLIAKAGTLNFAINATNLPNNYKVFLEDKITGAFSDLSTNNTAHQVVLEEAVNGIGRFYLHTKASVLNTENFNSTQINAYLINNNTLQIEGLNNENTKIKVFDILGKEVFKTSIKTTGANAVKLPNLSTGTYIVKIDTYTKKVFIKQ